MIDLPNELNIAIGASINAGQRIMSIYESNDFEIQTKSDNSPLTKADKEANKIIQTQLLKTGLPIVSEENKQISYRKRKDWKELWMVDPLDGTKEFIKRNGEFTVNIAKIKNGNPVFGVVYAPALDLLYFGGKQIGESYKAENLLTNNRISGNWQNLAYRIKAKHETNKIRIVGSRSHMNTQTQEFINQIQSDHLNKEIKIIPKGSSLKLCLLAQGSADYYPRFAPTMEWDTAAGDAICRSAGIKVIQHPRENQLTYNKEDLLNPFFLAQHE